MAPKMAPFFIILLLFSPFITTKWLLLVDGRPVTSPLSPSSSPCRDKGDVAFGDSCYRFVESTEPISYDAASDYCQQLAGNKTLAIVKSKREQLFLANYLETRGWPDALIGLRLVKTPWRWVLPLGDEDDDDGDEYYVTARNRRIHSPGTMLLSGQGCYGNTKIDASNSKYSSRLTVQGCIKFCREKSKQFAGVQAATLCLCTDYLPSSSDAAYNCTLKCSGNENQLCGNHRAVYYYNAAGDENDSPFADNWAVSRPGGDGYCAASMIVDKRHSGWFDLPCSTPLPFVCQFDQPIFVANKTEGDDIVDFDKWPLEAVISLANERGYCTRERCYMTFPRVLLNFAAANKFCSKRARFGKLVRIDSTAEQVIINRLVLSPSLSVTPAPTPSPIRFWIGATKLEFQWANGRPLRPGFAAWAENTEPTLSHEFGCVRMSSFEGAYMWRVRTCDDLLGSKTFICSGPPLTNENIGKPFNLIFADTTPMPLPSFEEVTINATAVTTDDMETTEFTTTEEVVTDPEIAIHLTTLPTTLTILTTVPTVETSPVDIGVETTTVVVTTPEPTSTIADVSTTTTTEQNNTATTEVISTTESTTTSSEPTTTTAMEETSTLAVTTTTEVPSTAPPKRLVDLYFKRKIDETMFVVFSEALSTIPMMDDVTGGGRAAWFTTLPPVFQVSRNADRQSEPTTLPPVESTTAYVTISAEVNTEEKPAPSLAPILLPQHHYSKPILATSVGGTSPPPIDNDLTTATPSTVFDDTTTLPPSTTLEMSTASKVLDVLVKTTLEDILTTNTLTTEATTIGSETETSTMAVVRKITFPRNKATTATFLETTMEPSSPIASTTMAPATVKHAVMKHIDVAEEWPASTTSTEPTVTTVTTAEPVETGADVETAVAAPEQQFENESPFTVLAASSLHPDDKKQLDLLFHTPESSLAPTLITASSTGASSDIRDGFVFLWWHLLVAVLLSVSMISLMFLLCYCYITDSKECCLKKNRGGRRISPSSSAGTSHHATPAISSREDDGANSSSPLPIDQESTHGTVSCAALKRIFQRNSMFRSSHPAENDEHASAPPTGRRRSAPYRVWPALSSSRVGPVSTAASLGDVDESNSKATALEPSRNSAEYAKAAELFASQLVEQVVDQKMDYGDGNIREVAKPEPSPAPIVVRESLEAQDPQMTTSQSQQRFFMQVMNADGNNNDECSSAKSKSLSPSGSYEDMFDVPSDHVRKRRKIVIEMEPPPRPAEAIILPVSPPTNPLPLQEAMNKMLWVPPTAISSPAPPVMDDVSSVATTFEEKAKSAPQDEITGTATSTVEAPLCLT